MWATLKNVHVHKVPGMCFSEYNDLFLFVKALQETLHSITSRIEEAITQHTC
jgi:hypothetical protein